MKFYTINIHFQESIRRLESLLKVKKEYEVAKVGLQNWLSEMEKCLEPNLDTSGDKETLQAKRQSLKVIIKFIK